jgi:hypothetical protein
MAEIGVVRFAHVAREVAEAALPRSRSPFSKHTFTQPMVLAIWCLMRYEDWTYREAEVRLREHAELRAALEIERAPDSTTLYRCLRRTGEEELTRLLQETIRRMPPAPEGGTTVAVDGTGLAPGAISTSFVNRVRDRGEGRTWRHWLTWVVVVDLPRRLILAQVAKPGPTNDGATLRPLLERARHLVPHSTVRSTIPSSARSSAPRAASLPSVGSRPGTCMACGRRCAPTSPPSPIVSVP